MSFSSVVAKRQFSGDLPPSSLHSDYMITLRLRSVSCFVNWRRKTLKILPHSSMPTYRPPFSRSLLGITGYTQTAHGKAVRCTAQDGFLIKTSQRGIARQSASRPRCRCRMRLRSPITPSSFSNVFGTKRKRPPTFLLIAFIYAGNDLRSHTLSRAVPSALRGLTSVFGMGTGGSPAVRSPTT